MWSILDSITIREAGIAILVSLAAFGAGWQAHVAVMKASNQDRVTKGSYVLKSRVEKEYIARSTLDDLYIPTKVLQDQYVKVEECEAQKDSLRKSGEIVGSKNSRSGQPPQLGNLGKSSSKSTASIVEKEGFAFWTDGCLRVGSTVTCSILVENQASSSRILAVWTRYFNKIDMWNTQGKNQTHAIAVDEFGNQYEPEGIREHETSWALNGSVQAEVPLRFELEYTDVVAGADQLTIVLGCTVGEKEDEVFEVVLRGISIRA